MGVSPMVDDDTREAFEVALRAALRDQARANATVEFLREKLGMAEGAGPIVLGPGEGANEARDVGPIQVTDGEFFGMSQPRAAVIFLERAGRTRPQRTEAIIAALRKGGVTFGGKDPVQSFYAILARTPVFTNVGKSTWGLSSWYPDRVRKPGKANAAAAPPTPGDADATEPGDAEPGPELQEPPSGE